MAPKAAGEQRGRGVEAHVVQDRASISALREGIEWVEPGATVAQSGLPPQHLTGMRLSVAALPPRSAFAAAASGQPNIRFMFSPDAGKAAEGKLETSLQRYIQRRAEKVHAGLLVSDAHPANQQQGGPQFGVFASEPLAEHEIVGEYQGIMLTGPAIPDFIDGCPWERQALILRLPFDQSVETEHGEHGGHDSGGEQSDESDHDADDDYRPGDTAGDKATWSPGKKAKRGRKSQSGLAPSKRQRGRTSSVGLKSATHKNIDAGELRNEMSLINDYRDRTRPTAAGRAKNVCLGWFQVRVQSGEWQDHVFVYTTKRVQSAAELLLDYSERYWQDHDEQRAKGAKTGNRARSGTLKSEKPAAGEAGTVELESDSQTSQNLFEPTLQQQQLEEDQRQTLSQSTVPDSQVDPNSQDSQVESSLALDYEMTQHVQDVQPSEAVGGGQMVMLCPSSAASASNSTLALPHGKMADKERIRALAAQLESTQQDQTDERSSHTAQMAQLDKQIAELERQKQVARQKSRARQGELQQQEDRIKQECNGVIERFEAQHLCILRQLQRQQQAVTAELSFKDQMRRQVNK